MITLTRPVPALTNQAALTVRGSVSKPAALLTLLTLDGQAVPLDALGGFSAALTLAQGANTLAFQAVDPAGNVGL